MTGRRSRDQGARIERGIVRALMAQGFAAVRVPLSGVAGGRFAGDVVMPHDPSGVRVCTGRVYRRQLPDELRNEARDPEHCPLFGPLAGCLLRLRSFRLSPKKPKRCNAGMPLPGHCFPVPSWIRRTGHGVLCQPQPMEVASFW